MRLINRPSQRSFSRRAQASRSNNSARQLSAPWRRAEASGARGVAPVVSVAIFERFSQPARDVLVQAHREVREHKHERIGSEHILLGLIAAEQSLAARVMMSVDLSVARVRQRVVEILGEGDASGSRQIPFAADAEKALAEGMHEADRLGSKRIATHHLLLGLLRDSESAGVRVLRDLGVEAERLRDLVVAGLEQAPEEPPAEAAYATSTRLGRPAHASKAAAARSSDDAFAMFCSFCGQRARHLFGFGSPTPNDVAICEECVELFYGMVMQEREREGRNRPGADTGEASV